MSKDVGTLRKIRAKNQPSINYNQKNTENLRKKEKEKNSDIRLYQISLKDHSSKTDSTKVLKEKIRLSANGNLREEQINQITSYMERNKGNCPMYGFTKYLKKSISDRRANQQSINFSTADDQ